jgi:hypothetical protein
VIISWPASRLGRLHQAGDQRDQRADHNRGRSTPLGSSVLGELAVGDGGELHTSSMDQIDPGVLRDSGQAGNSRHDFEIDAAAYARRCFIGNSVIQERITSNEPHHPTTCGGLLEHDLGSRSWAQRLVCFSQSKCDDLSVLSEGDRGMGQNFPLPIVVQDHRAGIGKRGNGTKCQ